MVTEKDIDFQILEHIINSTKLTITILKDVFGGSQQYWSKLKKKYEWKTGRAYSGSVNSRKVKNLKALLVKVVKYAYEQRKLLIEKEKTINNQASLMEFLKIWKDLPVDETKVEQGLMGLSIKVLQEVFQNKISAKEAAAVCRNFAEVRQRLKEDSLEENPEFTGEKDDNKDNVFEIVKAKKAV